MELPALLHAHDNMRTAQNHQGMAKLLLEQSPLSSHVFDVCNLLRGDRHRAIRAMTVWSR
jgi:hypothetical protein